MIAGVNASGSHPFWGISLCPFQQAAERALPCRSDFVPMPCPPAFRCPVARRSGGRRFAAFPVLLVLLTISAPARDLAPKPGSGESAFDGWGTSLCWFGNAVGRWSEPRRSEIANALFSAEGLGLTVVRYNIGGGDHPEHRHMPWFRQMEGFQDAAGQWRWEADPGQRWMLEAARRRGAQRFEAFSNSPPYWMTRSQCASGAPDGNHDNLKDGAEEAFSVYLATVVKHFRTEQGIRFDTLAPMNEPWTDYWRAGHNQEGCHFDPASQQWLILTLRRVLDREGLGDVGIAASEETNYRKAIESWRSFDEATRACVAQVNAHAYDTAQRTELRDLIAAAGKPLVMSEVDGSGDHRHDPDSMIPALGLARGIIDDLRELRPLRWIFWQAVEDWEAQRASNANWGLVLADLAGSSERWRLTKKYHALAQFSRFIRPGSTLLASPGADSAAALDPTRTRLVLVLRNAGKDEERATIDLGAFPPAEPEVELHRTSATEDLQPQTEVRAEDGRIELVLPAESISTLVVRLRRPAPL